MNRNRYSLYIIAIIAVAAVIGWILWYNSSRNSETDQTQAAKQGQPIITESVDSAPANTDPASADGETKDQSPVIIPSGSSLVAPIDRPTERATLKQLGTYVTPKNSPVKPEKFTGFHTGVDFETFPEEADTDVAIMAACNGPLLVKRTASGYGGVAVQRCELDKQLVTVVYGHLRLSSIKQNVGDNLNAGQQLGVLGTGYSSETDGERKHLHLSIHKGSSVNIAGYVKSKSALVDWLDILKYLH